ncbi:MAG: hypothetical protein Q9177_003184 [Variospora cf. flavescens]
MAANQSLRPEAAATGMRPKKAKAHTMFTFPASTPLPSLNLLSILQKFLPLSSTYFVSLQPTSLFSRSKGSVMDAIDERPLAMLRKRRMSTRLVDPEAHAAEDNINQQNEAENAGNSISPDPPKTPGNRKKRIRFSDPLEHLASSSTGLTPAMNRTKLLPASSVKAARKRLSLPGQLPRPATSPLAHQFPTTLSSTAIQFVPLRQAIDLRMMRRLKRNHMADEVNDIYAEKRKSKLGLQQELEDLRKELALAKSHGNEASNTPAAAIEDGERIAELESEINNLKQEMRERSANIDATIPVQADEDEGMVDGGFGNDGEDFPEKAVQAGSVDSATTTDQALSSTVVVEASTQVDLPSPSLSDICRSARLSFEYLFPGENAIGLEVSDPQPLIEAMISRVQVLKTELDRKKQKIAVSETSTSNMGKHLNSALAELERLGRQFGAMKAELDEVKAHASNRELEASTMEARWENTNEARRAAENQRDDYKRSINRLKPALEYYQHEVKELTQTIMDLENIHETALRDLRAEHTDDSDAALACQQIAFEEATSDLEAQVAAETTGRRKAEQSAVERLDRIKELENHQQELQAAVHEKQSIIRGLESELEAIKFSHESEVGQLNVRIGKLVSDLSSADMELTLYRQETARLANVLEQEKAAGIQAVETIRSEVKACATKADIVREAHEEGIKKRSDSSTQSFGLMTPVVEGGKFRDAEADEKVEGHVEYVRGKKRVSRPDSGVGLSIAEEVEEAAGDDALMEG